MISKEDQERIERAGEALADRHFRRPGFFLSNATWKNCKESFRLGAISEHHIAFNQGKIEGFNEGIEAAVIKLKALQIESYNYHDEDTYKMIEKLKKPM